MTTTAMTAMTTTMLEQESAVQMAPAQEPILRMGTRGSTMARTQSAWVADQLRQATGRDSELVTVTTHGDVSRAALTEIGGTGVFVGALREALLARTVDYAVHSLKDLPTGDADGLLLAAVPPRDDSRDALVARDGLTLGELPAGSRIGTGSPRRAAQLRALGLGLDVVAIRGNVDTRLRFVADGELDGIVVARAGLVRLGRTDAITEVIDPLQMLPAPGQGALAVECRVPADEADSTVLELLSRLDDAPTRTAVTAERVFLRTLEAGCVSPVGAYAEVAEGDNGPELSLRAAVFSTDGGASVRLSATGPLERAAELGRTLAERMLAEGAADLMEG